MNRTIKLAAAGCAALGVVYGIKVATGSEADGAGSTVEPVAPAKSALVAQAQSEGILPDSAVRTLGKIPAYEEVPQDIKEVENYLKRRWGHMEDYGLAAPGVLPEGDFFLQDKKVLVGVRGNGDPVYAKAFIRPEHVTGHMIRNPSQAQGLSQPPRASLPGTSQAAMQAALERTQRKLGNASIQLGLKQKKHQAMPPALDQMTNSGFRPPGKGGDGNGGPPVDGGN